MPFELRKTPAFQVALAGEKLNGAGREWGGGGGEAGENEGCCWSA